MTPAKVIATQGTNSSLDAKDKNIIEVLSKNSRTSVSSIARALKYSKEVVNYRIERLTKEKVITDFFTVIDTTKLGYTRFNVYLEFYTLSKQDEQRIVAYLLQHANVSWIISTSGKWDYMIQIYARTMKELDKVLMEISSAFLGLLKDYELSIITEYHHFMPNFLATDNETTHMADGPYAVDFRAAPKQVTKIDEIDMRLLKRLELDARIPVLQLSRELGISKDAVQNRIRRLIRERVIQGFRLRLNWHNLGYQYYSIMLKLKNIDQKKRDRLIAYLRSKRSVIAVFVQIGAWDLCVQTIVGNAIELKQLISEIKEAFKDIIEDNESVLYFDQHIFTYLPRIVMEKRD